MDGCGQVYGWMDVDVAGWVNVWMDGFIGKFFDLIFVYLYTSIYLFTSNKTCQQFGML